MDEIDALFARGGSGQRQEPRGRAAATSGQAAPWDDDIPAAPLPSEGTSSTRVASVRSVSTSAPPAGRDDRAAGAARLSQPAMGGALAPSVVRTAAPSTAYPDQEPGGNVSRMPSAARPAAPSASRPSDEPQDWHGGEEDRDDDAQARPKEGERDYFSVHIYGGKAALCFNADTTRKSTTSNEGNTVRLEAAPSKAARSYDWNRKVAIQFTVKELPFVLAVFMGWMPSVQFSAHGPKQDKGFSFEHQDGGKVFARVWQGKEAQMSVPVFAEDMYAVVNVLLRQMVKNSPFLGVDCVMSIVRQLSSSYQERGLEVKKLQPQAARSA